MFVHDSAPFQFQARGNHHHLTQSGDAEGSRTHFEARLGEDRGATEVAAAWYEPTRGFSDEHPMAIIIHDVDGQPDLEVSIDRTRGGQDARLRVVNPGDAPGQSTSVEFNLGTLKSAGEEWHFQPHEGRNGAMINREHATFPTADVSSVRILQQPDESSEQPRVEISLQAASGEQFEFVRSGDQMTRVS